MAWIPPAQSTFLGNSNFYGTPVPLNFIGHGT